MRPTHGAPVLQVSKSVWEVRTTRLDRFKSYNDLHGHKGGDLASKRMVRAIESCSRRVDVAARNGGEEFVLVLVDTDVAGGLVVAGRIGAQVETESIRCGSPLTVSIGVASYPEGDAAKGELLDKGRLGVVCGKERRPQSGAGLLRTGWWPRRPSCHVAARRRLR